MVFAASLELFLIPLSTAKEWQPLLLAHEKSRPILDGAACSYELVRSAPSPVFAAVTTALVNRTAGIGCDKEGTETAFKRIIHDRALHRETFTVLFV
jgi:hypothetical protein